MIVIEEFFSLCRHFRWLSFGSLGTCKFNGGHTNAKRTAEKIRCFLLGLKNGLDRLLNTLFPSER